MAKLALTMVFMQVCFKHMPPLELKILLAILSCWAIRQWGLSETNEYGTAWVIFPISFIHIPVVLATHNGLDTVAAYIASDNCSPTQVAIILRKIKDNSAGNKWGLGWIAIGC